MQIRIIKKKRGHLGKFIAAIPLSLIVGIAAFSFSTDDEYPVQELVKRGIEQKNNLKLSLSITEKWNDSKDDSSDGGSSTKSDDTQDVTNTATNGTGLNLLLINNIQTECFVKEYLSLCVENQNGELDVTNRSVTASLQTIIGINISESGFYRAGDGKILPLTDLPIGADGAPTWDGNIYSLKKWGTEQHSRLGASATGGPLQYISNGIITAIHTKSKYNTGLTTGGGIGDCYLLPDAICGLNDYLVSGSNVINVSSLSPELTTIVTTISHNRGAAGLEMLYGIPYNTILHGNASNYYNKASVSSEESQKVLQKCYDSISSIPDGIDAVELSSVNGKYIYSTYPLIAKGWYYSTAGGESAKAVYSDKAKKYWNKYFPNEQITDAASYIEAISRHTKKLSDELNIAVSECDATYGTSGGDYVRYTNASPGDVYYVDSSKSDAYKSGNKQLVISLEMLTAQHLYSVINGAAQVYAKMLKYAGVDVDQTNPSTYLGGFSNNNEWVPESGVTTDADNVLIANGLDTSAVTEQRMKVLRAATEITGITYKQCRHSVGCDGKCYDYDGRPSHLDCSSFIWRAFHDAGYDMSGFPLNTGAYAGSSKMKPIAFDDAKPGDILIRRSGLSGHAELFLGKKGSTYSFIEAFKPGKVSGYTTKDVQAISGSIYKFYRYVGFDD